MTGGNNGTLRDSSPQLKINIPLQPNVALDDKCVATVSSQDGIGPSQSTARKPSRIPISPTRKYGAAAKSSASLQKQDDLSSELRFNSSSSSPRPSRTKEKRGSGNVFTKSAENVRKPQPTETCSGSRKQRLSADTKQSLSPDKSVSASKNLRKNSLRRSFIRMVRGKKSESASRSEAECKAPERPTTLMLPESKPYSEKSSKKALKKTRSVQPKVSRK